MSASSPGKSIPADKSIKRILWVRADGLGDGLFSASMLEPIAARFPGAKITVVCRDSMTALYEHCPFIEEVIPLAHARMVREESHRQEVMGGIRARHPDIAINSAYFPEALSDVICAGSGARYIVGMDSGSRFADDVRHARRVAQYTHLIPSPGAWKHELDRYGDFLKGLETQVPALAPVIWSCDRDRSFAADLYAKHKFDPARTLVLFASAALDHQVYPYFGEALTGVCRERGFTVYVMGNRSSAQANERIAAGLAGAGVPVVNLSGELSLRQSAEVLRLCRLAVGNGTDSAHLAWAVGKAHVIVVGGGQFGRFLPGSRLTSAVLLPLSCYGCNWQCQHSRAHCVKDIRPEVLETAVREGLENPSAHPRLYLQHWSYAPLPPGIQPHFVTDMLPQMLLDLAYVMPEDAPQVAHPPPALSGCPLRYIRVKARPWIGPAVMGRA